MSKIRAHGKKVVVIPEEIPYVSPGGLVVPDSVKQVKQTGKVTSVGLELSDMFFVGDRVAFEPGAGLRVEENGVTLLILGPLEVLSVEKS